MVLFAFFAAVVAHHTAYKFKNKLRDIHCLVRAFVMNGRFCWTNSQKQKIECAAFATHPIGEILSMRLVRGFSLGSLSLGSNL